MKLATITNWAYGATVALTLISGTTMLMASGAQERERAAVEQRYRLDQATSRLGDDILLLSTQASDYVISGDPLHLEVYERELKALDGVGARLRHVNDAGATPDELRALTETIHGADNLRDEQQAALAARKGGDEGRARQIIFGNEYEREIDRIEGLIERFQYRLDQRTTNEVRSAETVARLWKMASEIALGVTGLLFLCVLYFIFKQRVLRPVVRLSDVVNRLAAQDYGVEAPDYEQIDEIGDMAQAIRVFRENGIERQRLEVERDADRVMRDLLSRMTQRMQGCDTLLDLKEVIQRFMPEVSQGLAGRLYTLDIQRNVMIEMCQWLGPVHSRNGFSPIACWALRRGLPHRPLGPTIDVPCDHLGDHPGDHDAASPVDSYCLPLIAQRETLGLLYFERNPDVVRTVDISETYLLMLAENVGLALANLCLRERLRELALADPLTGLANRRQLDSVLETQLAEAERLGEPISCLMLDVDHFKTFNDRYGHDAGDAVLRAVGEALRTVTREQGMAFRYGGEEFALLMPGFGPDQAAARAEDARARIAALRVSYEGQDLGAITASIGVATTPDYCPKDRLVQAADAALLRAKTQGRNRVERAVMRQQEDAAT
jgi:diguanylate cyclase (GGDEF)-like protein